MSLERFFVLRSGNAIPSLGYGTWRMPASQATSCVREALKSGYRHIDGAEGYKNHAEVGQGIRESGVKRDQFFLTSKLWSFNTCPEDVKPCLNQTLSDLKTDYLDLYLIHWPCKMNSETKKAEEAALSQTWQAMLEERKAGRVRALGISNFDPQQLHSLMKSCRSDQDLPEVHQLEAHPYLPQNEFIGENQLANIHVTAYSPLADTHSAYQSATVDGKRLIEHPEFVEFAQSKGMAPPIMMLCYGIARGISVIPKAMNSQHMKDNLTVFNHEFTAQDVSELEQLVASISTSRRRLNAPDWGMSFFKGLDM